LNGPHLLINSLALSSSLRAKRFKPELILSQAQAKRGYSSWHGPRSSRHHMVKMTSIDFINTDLDRFVIMSPSLISTSSFYP